MVRDDEDDEPPDIAMTMRLCACGCDEQEHHESGRCMFCGPEDCQGFTYDEETTLLVIATMAMEDRL